MGDVNLNSYFNKLLTRRAIAFLIDLSFIKYINQGFTLSWKVFLKNFFILPPEIAQKIDTLSNSLSILILPLIFVSYFTLTHFLSHGKTIGKLICHIKIETKNKEAPNFVSCLFRSFAYSFCFFIGPFLFLIPFITKDSRGIQDWVSNTIVTKNIKTKKEEKLKEMQLELFENKRAS